MIHQKIRTLRQAKGLTLKELADRTQTTAGYISQLERGLVDPSLSTLRKIAAVLGTPLFALMDNRETQSAVVRSEKRQKMTFPDSSIIHELLTPAAIGGQKPSDLLLFTSRLSSGSWSNEERISHNAEEWIYVTDGQIEIVAGEHTYSLQCGDCIYLKENIPHNIYNPGPAPAVCISAMTPSVFVSTVCP